MSTEGQGWAGLGGGGEAWGYLVPTEEVSWLGSCGQRGPDGRLGGFQRGLVLEWPGGCDGGGGPAAPGQPRPQCRPPGNREPCSVLSKLGASGAGARRQEGTALSGARSTASGLP